MLHRAHGGPNPRASALYRPQVSTEIILTAQIIKHLFLHVFIHSFIQPLIIHSFINSLIHSVHQFCHLSVCPPVHWSICLSVSLHLSFHPSIHQSLNYSVIPHRVCLFTCVIVSHHPVNFWSTVTTSNFKKQLFQSSPVTTEQV